MENASGRHEIKHYINHADYLQLRARLPFIAAPDENAAGGNGYRVRSLYFDNHEDKALREKIDGVNEREKFRLRLYNGDPSFIRLEKKGKKGGICFKESAVIPFEACSQLILGRYGALKETGDPLMLEFYAKLHFELLRPKIIVDYLREAYVFPAGNVRVTMDYDIRASLDPSAFLNRQVITVPIPDTIILEVKYDAFLPELIRGMAALGSRQQTAFSKYAATRTF